MSKKRREKREEKQSSRVRQRRWLLPVLGGAALLIVAVVLVGVLWPRSRGGGLEAQALPAHGDQNLLKEVQSFPSEGQEHVALGTAIEYNTSPPTSGKHYDNPIPAGFYTETKPYGNLVHSLEHSAVVIYYDPKELLDDAKRSLQAFAGAHQDSWASVIVVPNPEPNPNVAYALTAWTKMLKTNTYDVQVVLAFLAEYLGRGPEHPVR